MARMADEFGGGMVALVPSAEDRQRLAVDGGEQPDDLHLTLTYLGPDAGQIDEATIADAVSAAAAGAAPVNARVFGHATFNPDGYEGRDPCAVYLVGDTPMLDELKRALDPHASADQHAPYIAHVTAAYGPSASDLAYTGPVTFDALRLAVGDHSRDIPLTGSPGGESTVEETKRAFTQAERDALAKTPKAMDDGSYPIENVGDLKNAISAYGRCPKEKRPALRKHIVANAKRLKATNMVPRQWPEAPAGEKKSAVSFTTADDPFTEGVLLGLAGLDPLRATELKAGPPGATFPSPDPGATRLREHWVHGPGAKEIRWGEHGDFKRCVRELRQHVGERAEGLCNIYHREALGVAPGQESKSLGLWVPDEDAPGGWRAEPRAWAEQEWEPPQVLSVAPAAEVKAVIPTSKRDDEDVLATLDRYAAMVDGGQLGVRQADESEGDGGDEVSPEEVYQDAIDADIPWLLEPDGELTDPDEAGDSGVGDDMSMFDTLDEFARAGRG